MHLCKTAVMSNQFADAFDPFGLQETADEKGALVKEFPSASASFDPFNVDADNDAEHESPRSPPPVNRVSRSAIALPPKLNVKLTVHEEVSSSANGTSEGASHVTIEGSIHAQVQCSDATKNAPFRLVPKASGNMGGVITLRPNPSFVSSEGSTENIVKIPKHEIGMVPISVFSVSNEVQHMPLLLERKVTVSGTSCRIAVQVRSKLSNLGNLLEFTIALAIPECVNFATIDIVRGDGESDELKRTIVWKLAELQKGESFMVSAQAQLWDPTTEIQFPVMLRCRSVADQISDVVFEVAPADGHPSSITFTTAKSFRLLHRLA
jgi:hypothetical protein